MLIRDERRPPCLADESEKVISDSSSRYLGPRDNSDPVDRDERVRRRATFFARDCDDLSRVLRPVSNPGSNRVSSSSDSVFESIAKVRLSLFLFRSRLRLFAYRSYSARALSPSV